MNIFIFEPHPDDLLFGPGPLLFDWIKEGHNIHVITITDGRAFFRKMRNPPEEVRKMSEDDVAEMRIEEAKKAIEFLDIPQENHHLLYFHDADGQKYVEEAIEKTKPLLEEVDRIVLPSDNNSHVDHQAAHDIAIGASQELKLQDVEFLIYMVPSYGKFNEDSKEKQFQFKINETLQEKLKEWLEIYQSQKLSKYTWKMFTWFVNNVDERTYGIFGYQDIGRYHNF
ncbi:MAG: hypothetical protein BAJALOKI2v1_40052 [Promethearchaeota archaeon]|nr:MAG: hypothetical protein BAJALOKI2v1_40052 [Candidatus Lokiarchaeota archaeon]